MRRPTPQFLAEAFRLVSMCPMCKEKESTDVHVLSQEGDACLTHVACRACHMALVARLEPSDTGVACVAIVTDLSLCDARAALARRPITHNNVLSVHEALTDGTFFRIP